MNERRLQLDCSGQRTTHYALRVTHCARAFSLTEVLIAVGVLAVAMVFIAGLFPTAIYFSTISTERTIAAAAADEAFAKISLYVDSNLPQTFPSGECDYFQSVLAVDVNEFGYPSDEEAENIEGKKYFWSALCRRLTTELTSPPADRRVQVTVFVNRKAGFNTKYYEPEPAGGTNGNWPVPVKVNIEKISPGQLRITNQEQVSFINSGSILVDNRTGSIYRAIRRDGGSIAPDIIILDREWLGGSPEDVWVVPPPVGGGRYPCIAVYQKVMRF